MSAEDPPITMAMNPEIRRTRRRTRGTSSATLALTVSCMLIAHQHSTSTTEAAHTHVADTTTTTTTIFDSPLEEAKGPGTGPDTANSRRKEVHAKQLLYPKKRHHHHRNLDEDEDENDQQEEEDNDNEEEENEEDGEENDQNEEDEEDENQEEEEEDEEDQQEEEEEEQEEDENDDNNEEEDNNNNNENQNGDDDGNYMDDYYDDQLQDDAYTDDQGMNVIDDFYAYEEDPGPPTLFPLTAREVIGYSIASMALTLGASGGIGGGGIVVPVYILVMGLPLKVAVPCGAITVLGGAMGSTLLNWNRRHPLADRPIIDWDLVLVMEPLTLVGTLLGTLSHQLLSEKFLVVLLVLLLTVTAHTTLTKAMRMYHAEKRYIRHLRATQSFPPGHASPQRNSYTWTGGGGDQKTNSKASTEQNRSSLGVSAGNTTPHASNVTTTHAPPHYHQHPNKDEKEQILILNPDYVTIKTGLIEAEKFTPRTKIVALILMFSVLIFLNLMVGGGSYKSPWDIRCGSAAFWTVHVIMVVFLFASAWAAQTYVVARHEIKELVRFDYVHGDIIWNAKSAVLYPMIFITAGMFAGTLGIGGGVITVPLMLHFGLHPSVASASSSAMILFTSFASTTSFMVFGLLLPDFALVGFTIGFFAALLGQSLMRQARQATSASGRNFERNSYIAFVIGGVVLISALLMTVQYVLLIVDEPVEYGNGLCDGLRF